MTTNTGQKNLAAFQREKMLVGDPTAAMVGLNHAYSSHYGFKCILPADADGDLPPYGTPQYFFYFQDDSWNGVSQDQIKILKMEVDWNTPTNSTVSLHQTLYPAAFNSVFTTSWNDIVQKNSSQKLDAISSIFMFRAQYIRWSDYNTVMLCHVTDIDNNNTGGIRWYELREDQATGQFSVYQEGTYAPSDGDSRFVGSIAMDMNGSIGLAYSISGPNSFPSLGYTGRFPWQPLGQMWAQETIAVSGVSAQSGGNRFGDYSHMSLDPNGTTFWFTGEYIGTSGSRRTRIFSFEVQDFVGTPQTQLNESEMVAYVNNGDLNVELKNVQFDANVEIELFEMNGRSIRKGSGKIMGGMMKHVFDVNDLPAATYLVRVGNHDAQRVQKIIIQ